jgi:hypothetical protein
LKAGRTDDTDFLEVWLADAAPTTSAVCQYNFPYPISGPMEHSLSLFHRLFAYHIIPKCLAGTSGDPQFGCFLMKSWILFVRRAIQDVQLTP